MDKEIRKENFAKYRDIMVKIFGEEVTGRIIDSVTQTKLTHAPYNGNEESGLAYAGSLVWAILAEIEHAVKLNEMLPDVIRLDKRSIYRVLLLCNISRAIMYETNDNTWERVNRGMVYKFVDLEGALRTGERSLLIAMNAGVVLSPSEYEAIRIMDRFYDSSDSYARSQSGVLSLIVRQSCEYITGMAKEIQKYKKLQKK